MIKELITVSIIIIIIVIIVISDKNISTFSNNTNSYIIYYISLDKSVDRIYDMEKQLGELGELNYKRIVAVNGNSFKSIPEITKSENYPDLGCMGDENRTGHLTHAGCYLSHLKAWKTFLKSNFSKAVILEDDAEIIKSKYEIISLTNIINKYSVDILFLNASKNNELQLKHEIPRWGAHAYIINKHAAEVLFNMIKPGSKWLNSEEARCISDTCLFDFILHCAVKSSGLTYDTFGFFNQKKGLKSTITNEIRM